MKSIKLVIVFAGMALNGTGQDSSTTKIKELNISIGTFNTKSDGSSRVNVNPAISGSFGDYYFEARYNYEADNSASINVGKQILKKLKPVEIVPIVGFVFGSFKAVTVELQTSLESGKWALSTDNQFSFEYTQPNKSLYFNWTVARYKITNSFRIGISTILDKHVSRDIVFDKGITAALAFEKWGIRFYAFNYEKGKRYYWLSMRYNIRVKLIGK
ncbi:MAG: hypothetical protein ACM3H8_12115 [Sphingobacteriales bacterium]